MKILLLGEYSSLHRNLKEGLIEYGHDVTIAGYGDGFKKIQTDLSFDSNLPLGLDKIGRRVLPILNMRKLYGHDVIQIMNPFIFYRYFPTRFFHQNVLGNNEKKFLLAAGDDAYFWRSSRKLMEYGPFDDFLKYDIKQRTYFMESDSALQHNDFLIRNVDAIIPVMYEYKIAYKGIKKLKDIIPIPLNVDKIPYIENQVGDKLVIFHGLNRYGFKGTRHIEKAFTYLRQKYPNDLELIIDGRMPLDKYLAVMRRANIVIDQLNSYSCGVNALFALAQGKVVIGGAEEVSLQEMNMCDSPVINAKPTAASIVQIIENLIERRKDIPSIGFNSRKFVEKHHCHLSIANQYIKTWTQA